MLTVLVMETNELGVGTRLLLPWGVTTIPPKLKGVTTTQPEASAPEGRKSTVISVMPANRAASPTRVFSTPTWIGASLRNANITRTPEREQLM